MATATMLDVERSLGMHRPIGSSASTRLPSFPKTAVVYFWICPPPVVQDTTLLTEETVQVEVWGGNDPYIYPQQNKQLDADRKRSYLVCINLTEKKIMQLADRDVPQITLGDEGNAAVVLGETNVPYRKMTTWDQTAFY